MGTTGAAMACVVCASRGAETRGCRGEIWWQCRWFALKDVPAFESLLVRQSRSRASSSALLVHTCPPPVLIPPVEIPGCRLSGTWGNWGPAAAAMPAAAVESADSGGDCTKAVLCGCCCSCCGAAMASICAMGCALLPWVASPPASCCGCAALLCSGAVNALSWPFTPSWFSSSPSRTTSESVHTLSRVSASQPRPGGASAATTCHSRFNKD